MVITVRCNNWEIQRVLIYQGRSVNILYWDTFERFFFGSRRPQSFLIFTCGVLRRASVSEWLLITVFGANDRVRLTKVKYMVINNASSSHNMIIGQPTFNKLGFSLSTLYICMKYPLSDVWFKVIHGDQEIARKCNVESMKLEKKCYGHGPFPAARDTGSECYGLETRS